METLNENAFAESFDETEKENEMTCEEAMEEKEEQVGNERILKEEIHPKEPCKKEISGGEIASFVLSCASLVLLGGIPVLGIVFSAVCAILSICLGAPFRKEKNAFANAGFVISIVAIVLSIVAAIISVVLGNAIVNGIVYFLNQNSSPFGFGSPFYMFP